MERNVDATSIVMWLIAGMCVVLGVFVAPRFDGVTWVPLAIAAGIGLMAYRRDAARKAKHQ